MVAKGHRLGGLQVGEPGHDGVDLFGRQADGAALQAGQLTGDSVDGGAQVEPDIGGHLVVARAPGVQLLAGHPDQLRQPGFDIHVDVFQFHRPLEAPRADLIANLVQSPDDVCQFLWTEHSRRRKHPGVGQRPGDVLIGHALVKVHRRGKTLHKTVGGLVEAPAPQLAGLLLIAHWVWIPAVKNGRGARVWLHRRIGIF